MELAEIREVFAHAKLRSLSVAEAIRNASGPRSLGEQDPPWADRYAAAMSQVSREDVARIAKLARLRFDDAESDALAAQLSSILDYVEQLAPLATEDVPPTHHVLDLATPFREDVPGAVLAPEAALTNAPEHSGTAFSVPKVLEGEEEG